MTGQEQAMGDTYWREQIAEWNQSGLSGAEYCRRHQLIYHRFVYWRQKLDQPGTQSKTSTRSSSGFVKVVPASYENRASGLSVSLPNGMVIRGIDDSNIALVKALFDSL